MISRVTRAPRTAAQFGLNYIQASKKRHTRMPPSSVVVKEGVQSFSCFSISIFPFNGCQKRNSGCMIVVVPWDYNSSPAFAIVESSNRMVKTIGLRLYFLNPDDDVDMAVSDNSQCPY